MAETGAAAAATGNEGKTMGEVLGAGWLGEEPEIADDAIASVTDADIVVCGAGHAGTAVAVAPASWGRRSWSWRCSPRTPSVRSATTSGI